MSVRERTMKSAIAATGCSAARALFVAAAAASAVIVVEAAPSLRMNLSNVLGTATSVPGYERVMCQPVFQVTTPWGAPYMLFEKYKDEEKVIEAEGQSGEEMDGSERFSRGQRKERGRDVRPLALYFVDEHNARALADEMKQMKHMKNSELRVTCTSLGKAVRQSSNLGKGLPTGQPIDDSTGKMLTMEDGGSLRHKIVPSKRDLFYATRCRGRERVGFFAESPEEDAELMLQTDNIIEANKMGLRGKVSKNAARRMAQKRQANAEGAKESESDVLRREYAHMEGQVGCPVFHCPGLARPPPTLRKFFRGSKRAWETSSLTPLYFSYDDLMRDWAVMRTKKDSSIPESPPGVEVFNMFDVITSIDRDQWKLKRREELRRSRLGLVGKVPLVHRFMRSKGERSTARSGLEKVVFVPTSLGAEAKTRISNWGNGKPRLRPMRAWGKKA